MNRIGLYTLACMMMTMIACQKDYIEIPEEQEGSPVFSTQFSLDGTNTEFTAGLNDYYMFADQKTDENNVFVYTGNFADEACSTETCATSIQFEIRSGSTVPDPQPTNNLMVADYVYKDDTQPELDVYQVSLEGEYEEDDLKETFWDLGKGDNSPPVYNQASLVHNYIIDNPSNDIVPRFSVQSNRGHLASLGRTLYFDGTTPCSIDFDVIEDENGEIEMKAILEDNLMPSLLIWFFEDTADFVESIVPNLDSIFVSEYSLLVDYEGGCSSDIYRTFSQNNDGSLAYANSSFSYDVIKKYENGSRLGLSTFSIQYVDENGKVFRSDRQKQSELSYFRILSMEDYDVNEKGLPTKKLTVEYSCQVFAEDGSVYNIQNGTGVIAVAIEH